jgi:hypothetical protein
MASVDDDRRMSGMPLRRPAARSASTHAHSKSPHRTQPPRDEWDMRVVLVLVRATRCDCSPAQSAVLSCVVLCCVVQLEQFLHPLSSIPFHPSHAGPTRSSAQPPTPPQ